MGGPVSISGHQGTYDGIYSPLSGLQVSAHVNPSKTTHATPNMRKYVGMAMVRKEV